MAILSLAFLGALGVLLVAPAGADAQVRMLRAKQLSTGNWLQRVDSGSATIKPSATFKREVAAQFGLAESDVEVIETTGTEAQRQTAVQELGAGTHEGLAVVRAQVIAVERPDDLRRALGSIFAGTPAQKQARWGDVLEKYPAVATWLTLLRGPAPLSADAKALLTEITTRVKAKIGTGSTEVLTQAEYDALKTLAATYGLGSVVP